jgi:hemolysin-activating ACP:hemolysin acyltransferase
VRYLVAFFAVVVLAAAFYLVRPLADPGEPVSVLFVGNSYTTSNDLAGTFASMAADRGYDAEIEVIARGGAWLRDHVDEGAARIALTGGDWDFVVFQEQSIVPASGTERVAAMYPALRQLASVADDWDTQPVLYLTWARRDGFPDVGYTSYEPMQRAITEAYEGIAPEIGAWIAPVGEAWSIAHRSAHQLYQPDGSHPSVAGTYLAATVLYATIIGEDPTEIQFTGDLDPDMARSLQSIAESVVLDDRGRWHLPALEPEL